MVLPHIDIKPPRSRDLLQLSPRPRRPPQAIQPPHSLQHSRNSDLADVHAEAFVRPGAVVDVRVHGAIERDGFRFGVDDGVAGGGDEAHEDVVAWVDGDGAAVVVYGHGFHGLAVDAEGAVHSCALLADGFDLGGENVRMPSMA